MRFLFKNRRGVSNVFGYLFSFAVASMVMVSAVIMTKNVMDDRAAKVGNMEAQSIANKVADAIVEAMAVGQSMTGSDYSRTLDLPTNIAGLEYYIEVTEKFIYVNTTNGVIKKSCPNYGAGSSNIGMANGKIYGGSGSVNIVLNKSDYVYKFDFGTGNITSHSPVETGYFSVTNKSSTTSNDPPWLNEDCKARVPILVENDSPENMVDMPVKVVLSSSNFDYSMANVTITSSSNVSSDLTFYDPSLGVVAKIDVSPSAWEPKWFYTSYYDPVTPPNIVVTISELSGGYTKYHIDGETIKMKVMGRTGGREAKGSWDADTGKVTFNSKEALNMLENGNHYLNPGYNIVLYGLLKNGIEFSGSKYISIKNAKYVNPGSGTIETEMADADEGDTYFIKNGEYLENLHITTKNINLIGQSVDGVKLKLRIWPFGGPIIEIIDKANAYINIDSLSIDGTFVSWTDAGIYVQGSSYINITNCKVNRSQNGIWVRQYTSPTGSSYVSIYNCETYENGIGSSGGDGINIADSEYIRITNCESYSNNNEEGDGFDITNSNNVTLDDCKSYYNIGKDSCGVAIYDSNNCIIQDSIFYSNKGDGGDGIRIVTNDEATGCYSNQIINCTISDQNSSFKNNDGIYIENGLSSLLDSPIPANIIKNCSIHDNWEGIRLLGTEISKCVCNNYIDRCNIYNNSKNGIVLDSSLVSPVNDNYISNCNIYENGRKYNLVGLGYGGDGILLYGVVETKIENCSIFDNGDDGIQLGGLTPFWSQANIIRYNNIYCNGRSNGSGSGVYCGGGAFGEFGTNDNDINYNNFGFDYPYSRNCLDYNAKHAMDDYKGVGGSSGPANNWNNNFWDNNNPYHSKYYIPNRYMNNGANYSNLDNNPASSRYTNPDYITVKGAPSPSLPITVTLTTNSKIHDSFVEEVNPASTNGVLDLLWVDCHHHAWSPLDPLHPGHDQLNHIFIKFDLSSIPPGSTIQSATLSLYYRDWWDDTPPIGALWPNNGSDPGGKRTYGCHMLDDSPWNEFSVCWNRPMPRGWFGASSTATVPNTKGNWMNWGGNLKNDVQAWVSGTYPNEGWLIKDEGAYTRYSYAAMFDSKEKGGSSQPKLVIVYTPPSNDPGPYYHPRTIAKGINNVQPGGTVYVKNNLTGTPTKLNDYNERITINKPLTLKGENRNTVIINGSGTGNVIYVNKQNVFIDSLTIRSGNRGIYVWRNPVQAGYINIMNCKIYDNKQEGVYVALPRVNITNCIINNSGLGICSTQSLTKILNCSIHNNTKTTGTKEGIRLNTTILSQNILIDNCTINDNNKGIYLFSSNKNIIKNCDIKRNTNYGIELEDSGNVLNINTIKGCTIVGKDISDNTGIYLHATSDYNIIKNCDISSNKLFGIKLDSSYDNTIKNCVIHDNTDRGINITSSTGNSINNNKFTNNNGENKDAWDNGANSWNSDYPDGAQETDDKGGNLWDDYDEPPEGASDYFSGATTPQTGPGSDSIADNPYNISGGNNKDNYPWCKRPIEMPYYIDYWNPNGESVVLLNMSITNHSSKHIYLYYGSAKPATKHSIANVSIFFDDFNSQSLDTNKWQASGGIITTDSKGNITLDDNEYIITKSYYIAEVQDPPEVKFQKTVNNSMYIVEAKMNTNQTEGNMILLCQSDLDYGMSDFVSVNPPAKKLFLNNSCGAACSVFDQININELDHWIRLKSYIYLTKERYKTTQDYSNGSTYVYLNSTIYNYDSYSDEGTVSGEDERLLVKGAWVGVTMFQYFDGRIGLGCGLSSYQTAPLTVDWIRAMKTPFIPPTITVGSMESANYGWDPASKVYSKNIIPLAVFDNPYNPGPLLRDFNNGTQPGTFVIKNLTKGEYTITITMGNASGKCNITEAEFKEDTTYNSYGKLIIPATETGEFETRWHTINFNWGTPEKERDLRVTFSSPAGNWTVNAMTIERGKKGVKIDL